MSDSRRQRNHASFDLFGQMICRQCLKDLKLEKWTSSKIIYPRALEYLKKKFAHDYIPFEEVESKHEVYCLSLG